MLTLMLREFRQLPQLTIPQALRVLKAANVSLTAAATITGVSRVTLHRWSQGHINCPRVTSIEAVSELAYRVLRALRHGHVSSTSKRLSASNLLAILDDKNYDAPLMDTPPHELLPKAWLDQFNLSREHHATESVL